MPPQDPEPKRNAYQSYLEDKHAKFNTPGRVIDDVVKAAAGSKPRERHKVVLGEVNEVYVVVTESNQQLIVRISRSEHPRFEAEKWAIDGVKKKGVPAPEVLLIKSESVEDMNLTFCVEKKLPGTPLRDVHYTERERISDIVQQAGEILAKIHSVEAQGFGGFDKPGVGKYGSWSDYIMEVAKDRDAIVEAATKMGMATSDVDRGLDILKQNARLFENVSSQLLHSDFSSKHILVDGNTITGILDFEGSKSGDPVWDFA